MKKIRPYSRSPNTSRRSTTRLTQWQITGFPAESFLSANHRTLRISTPCHRAIPPPCRFSTFYLSPCNVKPALGLAVARLFRDMTSCRPRDWETVQRLSAGALEFYRHEARQCCESRMIELSVAQAIPGSANTDADKCSIIRHFLSIVGDRSIIPLNPAGFRQLVEALVMSERGLPAPPGP